MISTDPDLYVSIDQDFIANTTNSRWDSSELRHKIFLVLSHHSGKYNQFLLKMGAIWSSSPIINEKFGGRSHGQMFKCRINVNY